MIFTIGIYGAPYATQATISAWEFIQAALARHHQIQQIFFAHGGTLNASPTITITQDEIHWPQRWQNFHRQTHIPLFVCPTSAFMYGITEQHLFPEFNWGGLTQFAHALLTSDRHLIFGD